MILRATLEWLFLSAHKLKTKEHCCGSVWYAFNNQLLKESFKYY